MADNTQRDSIVLTPGELADILGIRPETLAAILRRKSSPQPLRPQGTERGK
jgi:hypothetical protein